jgi:hypothetical protein
MSGDTSQERSKKFQSYKIIKKLGGGAFGTVYLATKEDRGVALKEIICQDFDETNHAVSELVIAKNLSHPNVVKYNDVFLDMVDGELRVYLELQLCEGGDFRKYRLSNELGQQKILSFSMQIIEALEFMHKNNVIHRDLKPDNILMNKEQNQLLICDFGCSTLKESVNQNHSTVGTLFYAAPEIMKGETGYTYPVDVYAFGAILVFLALKSEKPPIYMELLENENEYFAKLEVHLKKAGFDGFYYELVRSCLQKDPSKRPTAETIRKNIFKKLNGGFEEVVKKEVVIKQLEIEEDDSHERSVYLCCRWLYKLKKGGKYDCVSKQGGWAVNVATWGADNRLYLIFNGTDHIVRYDPKNQEVITISNLRWSNAAAFVCLFGQLYYFGENVWVIDTTSGKYAQITSEGDWDETTSVCVFNNRLWICKNHLYSMDYNGEWRLESTADWENAQSIFPKDSQTLYIVCSWIWEYNTVTGSYVKASLESGWESTRANACIGNLFYFIDYSPTDSTTLSLMMWDPKTKERKVVNGDDWANCTFIV